MTTLADQVREALRKAGGSLSTRQLFDAHPRWSENDRACVYACLSNMRSRGEMTRTREDDGSSVYSLVPGFVRAKRGKRAHKRAAAPAPAAERTETPAPPASPPAHAPAAPAALPSPAPGATSTRPRTIGELAARALAIDAVTSSSVLECAMRALASATGAGASMQREAFAYEIARLVRQVRPL